MNGRNIDGGHIKLSVLRRVPRAGHRRLTIPGISVVLFLVAAGAIAFYWVEVFGPIFAIPDDPKHIPFHTAQVERYFAEAKVQADIGEPGEVQLAILAAAREQVQRGVRYSDEYFKIRYPGGDVPAGVGASTDIVVRSLRAVGVDLQQAIQEDRKAHPERYPTRRWKRRGPDPSIDHRRVANVYVYLKEHAESVTIGTDKDALLRYHAGDIVMWGSDGSEFPVHVGIVTDRHDDDGVPFVVDLNRKDGRASERHRLLDWRLRAHFRVSEVPLPEDPAPEGAIAGAQATPQTPGGAGAGGATPQPAAARP